MKHAQHNDYFDDSDDLVGRVRAAREAAQRKMEEFGDPSEYEITIIQGHGPEESPSETAQKTGTRQPSFDFAKVETADSQTKSLRNSVKNERTELAPDFASNDANTSTTEED